MQRSALPAWVLLLMANGSCLGDEAKTVSTDGGAGSSSGGTGGACALPDGGACDALHQCGCASGQSCLFMGDGTTLCKAEGGTKEYQACAAFDACKKGLMCVSGVCKPFCEKTSDCPGPSRICEQVVGVAGALVCTAGCDLMSPGTVCGPGTTCMPLANGAQGTDCKTSSGQGGSCSTQFDCKPGYACVGSNCERWCRVGYPDCGATSCLGGLNVYVNGFEYGTCG